MIRKIKPLVAALTTVTFVFTQALSPLPQARAQSEVLNTASRISAGFNLNIPFDLGTIETVRQGQGPAIIHIQTAHGNFEAQKKIAAILHYLKNQYGFKILLLEGSAFKLDPEMLRFFPGHPVETMEVNEELARKAIVKGPELFLLDEKEAEGYGIEELDAYRANVKAFRDVIAAKSHTEQFLENVNLQIERLTAPYLNSELKGFVRRLDTWETAKTPFETQLTELKDAAAKHLKVDLADASWQLNWPMLVRVFKLRAIEKRIDLEAYGQEKERFLHQLKMMMDRGSSILDKSQNAGSKIQDPISNIYSRVSALLASPLSEHHLSDPETGLLFEEMASKLPAEFNYKDYPQVTSAIAHIVLRSELQGAQLIQEVERLTDRILDQLAETRQEKEIVKALRDYSLLKKLFALELVPKDYEKIMNAKSGEQRAENPSMPHALGSMLAQEPLRPSTLIHRIAAVNADGRVRDIAFEQSGLEALDSLFDKAMEFYAGTKLRDEKMLENIEKKMTELSANPSSALAGPESGLRTSRPVFPGAVVITGGFHADPFRKHFAERDRNYALISPKITTTGGREEYLKVMMGGKAEKRILDDGSWIMDKEQNQKSKNQYPTSVPPSTVESTPAELSPAQLLASLQTRQDGLLYLTAEHQAVLRYALAKPEAWSVLMPAFMTSRSAARWGLDSVGPATHKNQSGIGLSADRRGFLRTELKVPGLFYSSQEIGTVASQLAKFSRAEVRNDVSKSVTALDDAYSVQVTITHRDVAGRRIFDAAVTVKKLGKGKEFEATRTIAVDNKTDANQAAQAFKTYLKTELATAGKRTPYNVEQALNRALFNTDDRGILTFKAPASEAEAAPPAAPKKAAQPKTGIATIAGLPVNISIEKVGSDKSRIVIGHNRSARGLPYSMKPFTEISRKIDTVSYNEMPDAPEIAERILEELIVAGVMAPSITEIPIAEFDQAVQAVLAEISVSETPAMLANKINRTLDATVVRFRRFESSGFAAAQLNSFLQSLKLERFFSLVFQMDRQAEMSETDTERIQALANHTEKTLHALFWVKDTIADEEILPLFLTMFLHDSGKVRAIANHEVASDEIVQKYGWLQHFAEQGITNGRQKLLMAFAIRYHGLIPLTAYQESTYLRWEPFLNDDRLLEFTEFLKTESSTPLKQAVAEILPFVRQAAALDTQAYTGTPVTEVLTDFWDQLLASISGIDPEQVSAGDRLREMAAEAYPSRWLTLITWNNREFLGPKAAAKSAKIGRAWSAAVAAATDSQNSLYQNPDAAIQNLQTIDFRGTAQPFSAFAWFDPSAGGAMKQLQTLDRWRDIPEDNPVINPQFVQTLCLLSTALELLPKAFTHLVVMGEDPAGKPVRLYNHPEDKDKRDYYLFWSEIVKRVHSLRLDGNTVTFLDKQEQPLPTKSRIEYNPKTKEITFAIASVPLRAEMRVQLKSWGLPILSVLVTLGWLGLFLTLEEKRDQLIVLAGGASSALLILAIEYVRPLIRFLRRTKDEQLAQHLHNLRRVATKLTHANRFARVVEMTKSLPAYEATLQQLQPALEASRNKLLSDLIFDVKFIRLFALILNNIGSKENSAKLPQIREAHQMVMRLKAHPAENQTPEDIRLLFAAHAWTAAELLAANEISAAEATPLIHNPKVPQGHRWSLLSWMEMQQTIEAMIKVADRTRGDEAQGKKTPQAVLESLMREYDSHAVPALAMWLLTMTSPKEDFLFFWPREFFTLYLIQHFLGFFFNLLPKGEIKAFENGGTRLDDSLLRRITSMGKIPARFLKNYPQLKPAEIQNLAAVAIEVIALAAEEMGQLGIARVFLEMADGHYRATRKVKVRGKRYSPWRPFVGPIEKLRQRLESRNDHNKENRQLRSLARTEMREIATNVENFNFVLNDGQLLNLKFEGWTVHTISFMSPANVTALKRFIAQQRFSGGYPERATYEILAAKLLVKEVGGKQHCFLQIEYTDPDPYPVPTPHKELINVTGTAEESAQVVSALDYRGHRPMQVSIVPTFSVEDLRLGSNHLDFDLVPVETLRLDVLPRTILGPFENYWHRAELDLQKERAQILILQKLFPEIAALLNNPNVRGFIFQGKAYSFYLAIQDPDSNQITPFRLIGGGPEIDAQIPPRIFPEGTKPQPVKIPSSSRALSVNALQTDVTIRMILMPSAEVSAATEPEAATPSTHTFELNGQPWPYSEQWTGASLMFNAQQKQNIPAWINMPSAEVPNWHFSSGLLFWVSDTNHYLLVIPGEEGPHENECLIIPITASDDEVAAFQAIYHLSPSHIHKLRSSAANARIEDDSFRFEAVLPQVEVIEAAAAESSVEETKSNVETLDIPLHSREDKTTRAHVWWPLQNPEDPGMQRLIELAGVSKFRERLNLEGARIFIHENVTDSHHYLLAIPYKKSLPEGPDEWAMIPLHRDRHDIAGLKTYFGEVHTLHELPPNFDVSAVVANDRLTVTLAPASPLPLELELTDAPPSLTKGWYYRWVRKQRIEGSLQQVLQRLFDDIYQSSGIRYDTTHIEQLSLWWRQTSSTPGYFLRVEMAATYAIFIPLNASADEIAALERHFTMARGRYQTTDAAKFKIVTLKTLNTTKANVAGTIASFTLEYGSVPAVETTQTPPLPLPPPAPTDSQPIVAPIPAFDLALSGMKQLQTLTAPGSGQWQWWNFYNLEVLEPIFTAAKLDTVFANAKIASSLYRSLRLVTYQPAESAPIKILALFLSYRPNNSRTSFSYIIYFDREDPALTQKIVNQALETVVSGIFDATKRTVPLKAWFDNTVPATVHFEPVTGVRPPASLPPKAAEPTQITLSNWTIKVWPVIGQTRLENIIQMEPLAAQLRLARIDELANQEQGVAMRQALEQSEGPVEVVVLGPYQRSGSKDVKGLIVAYRENGLSGSGPWMLGMVTPNRLLPGENMVQILTELQAGAGATPLIRTAKIVPGMSPTTELSFSFEKRTIQAPTPPPGEDNATEPSAGTVSAEKLREAAWRKVSDLRNKPAFSKPSKPGDDGDDPDKANVVSAIGLMASRNPPDWQKALAQLQQIQQRHSEPGDSLNKNPAKALAEAIQTVQAAIAAAQRQEMREAEPTRMMGAVDSRIRPTVTKLIKLLARRDPLPEKPGVIMVFGSPDDQPAKTAAELYKHYRQKKITVPILVSGRYIVGAPDATVPEAHRYKEILIAQGVPSEHIIVEDRAQNMGQNAKYSHAKLTEDGAAAPEEAILIHSWRLQPRGSREARRVFGDATIYDYAAEIPDTAPMEIMASLTMAGLISNEVDRANALAPDLPDLDKMNALRDQIRADMANLIADLFLESGLTEAQVAAVAEKFQQGQLEIPLDETQAEILTGNLLQFAGLFLQPKENKMDAANARNAAPFLGQVVLKMRSQVQIKNHFETQWKALKEFFIRQFPPSEQYLSFTYSQIGEYASGATATTPVTNLEYKGLLEHWKMLGPEREAGQDNHLFVVDTKAKVYWMIQYFPDPDKPFIQIYQAKTSYYGWMLADVIIHKDKMTLYAGYPDLPKRGWTHSYELTEDQFQQIVLRDPNTRLRKVIERAKNRLRSILAQRGRAGWLVDRIKPRWRPAQLAVPRPILNSLRNVFYGTEYKKNLRALAHLREALHLEVTAVSVRQELRGFAFPHFQTALLQTLTGKDFHISKISSFATLPSVVRQKLKNDRKGPYFVYTTPHQDRVYLAPSNERANTFDMIMLNRDYHLVAALAFTPNALTIGNNNGSVVITLPLNLDPPIANGLGQDGKAVVVMSDDFFVELERQMGRHPDMGSAAYLLGLLPVSFLRAGDSKLQNLRLNWTRSTDILPEPATFEELAHRLVYAKMAAYQINPQVKLPEHSTLHWDPQALKDIITTVRSALANGQEIPSIAFLPLQSEAIDPDPPVQILVYPAEEILTEPAPGEMVPLLTSLVEMITSASEVEKIARQFNLLNPENAYAYTFTAADLSWWGRQGLTREALSARFNAYQIIRAAAQKKKYVIGTPSGKRTLSELNGWTNELISQRRTQADIEAAFEELQKHQAALRDYAHTLRSRREVITEAVAVSEIAQSYNLLDFSAYSWTFTWRDMVEWADWGHSQEELQDIFAAWQKIRQLAQEIRYTVKDTNGLITASAMTFWVDQLLSGQSSETQIREIFFRNNAWAPANYVSSFVFSINSNILRLTQDLMPDLFRWMNEALRLSQSWNIRPIRELERPIPQADKYVSLTTLGFGYAMADHLKTYSLEAQDFATEEAAHKLGVSLASFDFQMIEEQESDSHALLALKRMIRLLHYHSAYAIYIHEQIMGDLALHVNLQTLLSGLPEIIAHLAAHPDTPKIIFQASPTQPKIVIEVTRSLEPPLSKGLKIIPKEIIIRLYDNAKDGLLTESAVIDPAQLKVMRRIPVKLSGIPARRPEQRRRPVNEDKVSPTKWLTQHQASIDCSRQVTEQILRNELRLALADLGFAVSSLALDTIANALGTPLHSVAFAAETPGLLDSRLSDSTARARFDSVAFMAMMKQMLQLNSEKVITLLSNARFVLKPDKAEALKADPEAALDLVRLLTMFRSQGLETRFLTIMAKRENYLAELARSLSGRNRLSFLEHRDIQNIIDTLRNTVNFIEPDESALGEYVASQRQAGLGVAVLGDDSNAVDNALNFRLDQAIVPKRAFSFLLPAIICGGSLLASETKESRSFAEQQKVVPELLGKIFPEARMVYRYHLWDFESVEGFLARLLEARAVLIVDQSA
jgi:hypothetical protein